MDLSRFLTPKDFFNYYIAGIIWIADILCIICITNPFLLNNFWDLYRSIESITSLKIIYELIILIIFPYTIGFSLGPLSSRVTKELRNKFDGDPIKWIITGKNDDKYKNRHMGKRLPKAQKDRIEKVIAKTLGYALDERYWFYAIRAYVLDNGGKYVVLAERAQYLANLAESLFLPFPIFCAIVTWIITCGWYYFDVIHFFQITNNHIFMIYTLYPISVSMILVLSVWIGVSWILFDRYLELRRDWAMHIYREFLILTANVTIPPP